jgi:hypothetical protein
VTRSRSSAAVAALLLAGSLSGCGEQLDAGVDADCGGSERTDNAALVLMAQAVPTAPLIPCIRLVPASWRRGDLEVRSGRATFSFDSAPDEGSGTSPLTVELRRSCDVAGATEVPSDKTGTTRWERLSSVSPAYLGKRFYVYDGGCTILSFALSGPGRVQAVGEASLAVAFVSRDAIAADLRERSDGRLELDPPESRR